MRRSMMVVAILLLCIAAVMQLAAETSNTNAKDIITEMTAGMNLLAEQVEEMSGPENFIEACNCYAKTVEAYGKKMYAVVKAHREWGENPPEEMQAAMKRLNTAVYSMYK